MTWHIRTRNHAIPAASIEARHLIHELLKCNSQKDTNEIKLWCGSQSVNAIDLLSITQIDGPLDTFHFEGDFRLYNGIGWQLQSGQIVIEGDVGSRLGAEIAGGTIQLQGNCGSWAGVAARGGRICIHGNTGDWLGANWPGENKGMTGGELFVTGNSGKQAGSRMRRGTIAIGGSALTGLGQEMIAGSIFVGGDINSVIGQGMKRGSIVITDKCNMENVMLPSFYPATNFRPLTLDMQFNYLKLHSWEKADEMMKKKFVRRYFGDTLALGLGEVIVLSNEN